MQNGDVNTTPMRMCARERDRETSPHLAFYLGGQIKAVAGFSKAQNYASGLFALFRTPRHTQN